MALFGSHWNEDDRIPQKRGSRAKMPIFEDNWEEVMLNNLRPKMEWMKEKDPNGHTIYYCSNCGNDEYYQPNFCPECGAMRRDLE